MLATLRAFIPFIVLSITIAGFSYYLSTSIKDSYTIVQQDAFQSKLSSIEFSLANWYRQTYREYQLWLNSPVIQSYSENLESNIDPWLKNVVSFISVRKILFTDSEGKIISSSDGSTGRYFHNERNLNEAISDSLNTPKFLELENEIFIVLSIPTLTIEGDIAFTAHFLLDSGNGLSEIIDSFGVDNYEILVITKDNQSIYGKYNPSNIPKFDLSDKTNATTSLYGDNIFISHFSGTLDLILYISISKGQFYNNFYVIENIIVLSSMIFILLVGIVFLKSKIDSHKIAITNLKYKTSFTDSFDAKILLKRSGEIIEINKLARKIHGKSLISIHDIANRDILESWNKYIKSNRDQNFSMSQGVNYYNGFIKSMTQGKVEFVLISYSDTTDIVNISNQIQEKEERLRTTLIATNQGYFDLNFKQKKEYYDPSLIHMLGYDHKSILNRSFMDKLTHPDDFHVLAKMNVDIFNFKENMLTHYEVRMKHKSGKWRYILISLRLLELFNGNPGRLVGIHQDITERKISELLLLKEKKNTELLNNELKKSAKIKDQFIATMSHELRTPLNAVISLSDLMKTNSKGNLSPHQIDHLTSIENAGRHLLTIINDILDISKLASGKMSLNNESFSIKDSVKSCIDVVSSLAREKSITISESFQCNTLYLLADKKRFKQILINLFSNAIKFTEKEKAIGINVKEQNDVIQFEIWDEGIGMNEDEAKSAFQDFVQIDSKLGRLQEGTGLGLPLVKRLVELHGGTISIKSTKSQGTSVTFSLPKSAEASEPPLFKD